MVSVKESRRLLWVSTLGILVFFGLRIHNIDAIAIFIDESISVGWSTDIGNDILLQHTRDGKLVLPYYLFVFQPQFNAVWVARLSQLILTCLGLAAATAIAGRYGGEKGGFVAVMLVSASPMLFFFDRLLLADTMLHVATTVWVWSLVKTFDRPRPSFALALTSGLLYVMCMFAKAPAIFLLPLPLVLAWLVSRWLFVDRLKIVAALLGTFCAVWIPFSLVLSSRQIDYFGKSSHVLTPSGALFNLGRIVEGLKSILEVVVAYHNAALIFALAVLCLVAIFLNPRLLLSLLAGVIGFEFALAWLGGPLFFNRYIVPVIPLFFVAASIAMVGVSRVVELRWKRNVFPILVGMIVVWVATVSAPFILDLYDQPSSARLPEGDWQEYVGRNSSGYGIQELASYLTELAAHNIIVVEGAFVGCYTLGLYLEEYPGVVLQCPNVLSGDRRATYLNRYLPNEAEIHASYYLVLETDGLVSHEELTSIQLTTLAEFPRPGNFSVIQLYAVNA